MQFICSKCNYRRQLSREQESKFAGKKIACPKCKTETRLRNTPVPQPVQSTPEPQPPISVETPRILPAKKGSVTGIIGKVLTGVCGVVVVLVILAALIPSKSSSRGYSSSDHDPIEFESRGYRMGQIFEPEENMYSSDLGGFCESHRCSDTIKISLDIFFQHFQVDTVSSTVEGIQFDIVAYQEKWEPAFIEKYGEPHQKSEGFWTWKTTNGDFFVSADGKDKSLFHASIRSEKLNKASAAWLKHYDAKIKKSVQGNL